MSFTIKDQEALRLVQAISRATGESMAQVVMESLRERHARIERRKAKADVDELLAIADRAAALLEHPRSRHSEMFYDENGLPK